ncbi:hypothetical protein CR3_0784 [Cupriavidus gilardii CR3]|uniref:DUF1640 domain-containing protein n=1 Tax=Cupriavidus gilardii TaxID=82541 RepID=A0A849B5D2_9BURK|nr:hypothetical protein [Cupriavidus gilardii]ALD90033.1 hypothetical protein CR3_0784 [Cupriavidus gilardii CR3]QQE07561.1 hypothetical protein IC580_04075 [Cupriavidus sp. ISTL7]KAB0598555.1 hypothetical protein F7Q96_03085 [Cupriavidus gilardii]MCT9015097.1 CCDC90 family protein [Cupriavidus gilardii]MCT9054867.1 CCDC90 family protein [Cupriavidus gilardii]
MDRIDRLEQSVTRLEGDVSMLKTDVSTLKADVSSLKTDVSSLKTDVSSLKTDVAHLTTSVADIQTTLTRLDAKLDLGEIRASVERAHTDIYKWVATLAISVAALGFAAYAGLKAGANVQSGRPSAVANSENPAAL